MDVKDRLLQFIKQTNLTTREFELLCGMSNGYIASMRKGLGTQKLNNVLSRFPELNREWLLFGEGEMIKNSGNFIQGDVNGGVVQSGGRHQSINISLPSEGEQKIIRPDGTVEIQSINSNGGEYERRIKDLEQIISTQKELIETLKMLANNSVNH